MSEKQKKSLYDVMAESFYDDYSETSSMCREGDTKQANLQALLMIAEQLFEIRMSLEYMRRGNKEPF